MATQIVTTHLTKLLKQAAFMAEQLDGEFVTPQSGLDLELRIRRVMNLASHGAQELNDELLVKVFGMAPVE